MGERYGVEMIVADLFENELGVDEAAYRGNLGFEEMMIFMRKASKQDQSRMDKYLQTNKTGKAWALLKRVTGTKLKGQVKKWKNSPIR